MERDLIREIQELTSKSFSSESEELNALRAVNEKISAVVTAEEKNHSLADSDSDFSLIRDLPEAKATVKTVAPSDKKLNLRPEPNKTPALPEHFQADQIPVVEYEHKKRSGSSALHGPLSPILREKRKP
jgi:hypothetical protein